MIDILLYLAVFLTLGYLIYRYARYSPWRSTQAGKAFMGMKVSFLALVAYALLGVIFPYDEWRDAVRPVIVTAIEVALIFQLATVMKLQKGNKVDAENQTEEPYQPVEP